jgi:hypothetical protein
MLYRPARKLFKFPLSLTSHFQSTLFLRSHTPHLCTSNVHPRQHAVPSFLPSSTRVVAVNTPQVSPTAFKYYQSWSRNIYSTATGTISFLHSQTQFTVVKSIFIPKQSSVYRQLPFVISNCINSASAPLLHSAQQTANMSTEAKSSHTTKPMYTTDEKPKILTLVLVCQELDQADVDAGKGSHRVLLGMKKRGFGAGKYNGFGGKVEAKETIREAALRGMIYDV